MEFLRKKVTNQNGKYSVITYFFKGPVILDWSWWKQFRRNVGSCSVKEGSAGSSFGAHEFRFKCADTCISGSRAASTTLDGKARGLAAAPAITIPAVLVLKSRCSSRFLA